MKKKLNIFPVIAVACIIMSCSNSTKQSEEGGRSRSFSEFEKASYLIGEWQSNTPEGVMVEVWTKKNDSAFSGRSCFIVGNDTVSSEEITLEQNANELFYVPVVKDQNNNEPVKFVLTSSTDKQLVFENPQHDFPQVISYTQLSHDSLVAEISGTLQGKSNSQKFPMKRIR